MNLSFKNLFDSNKWLVVICLVLIIADIAAAMFLSLSLSAPICVLVSSLSAIILTVIMFKPANKYFNSIFKEQEEADFKRIEQLAESKTKLELQVDDLTDMNNTLNTQKAQLEKELDTLKQYTSFHRNENMEMNLETMEYEKSGYEVKEEKVRDTEQGKDIPQGNFLSSDKGEQKVLFVKRYHEKALIGIDLTQIKFCKKGGKIYLEGVAFKNLHPEMRCKDDDGDYISHCLVLNDKDGGLSINDSDRYDNFKGWYSNNQDQLFLKAFDSDVANLCTQYTSVFKDILKKRFPQVEFVADKIANVLALASCDTFYVKASSDLDIIQLSNYMVTISSTMRGLSC